MILVKLKALAKAGANTNMHHGGGSIKARKAREMMMTMMTMMTMMMMTMMMTTKARRVHGMTSPMVSY